MTEEQKQLIDQHWQELTYSEMHRKFKVSIYKIYSYCKSKGYSKGKKVLTEEQKQFIRDNYLKMKESDMAKQLEVTKFYVQSFKRSEGLAKEHWNREKKVEVKESIFFNVDERLDWVA